MHDFGIHLRLPGCLRAFSLQITFNQMSGPVHWSGVRVEPIPCCMTHITHSFDSECDAPLIVSVERRRQPDRRTVWRGGRRDTDWINRPPGAWERAAADSTGGNIWSRFFVHRQA